MSPEGRCQPRPGRRAPAPAGAYRRRRFADTAAQGAILCHSGGFDAGYFRDTANQLRYQGTPLSDDEIRRIASYQQTFNEMTRGERFVQEVLRGKARARERWIIGVPVAVVALLGLVWLTRRLRKAG